MGLLGAEHLSRGPSRGPRKTTLGLTCLQVFQRTVLFPASSPLPRLYPLPGMSFACLGDKLPSVLQDSVWAPRALTVSSLLHIAHMMHLACVCPREGQDCAGPSLCPRYPGQNSEHMSLLLHSEQQTQVVTGAGVSSTWSCFSQVDSAATGWLEDRG